MACLPLVVLAAALTQQGAARADAIAPAAGRVTVDVTAVDSRGRQVDTLKAGDFLLQEDGAPQTIDEARYVHAEGGAGADSSAAPIVSASDEKAQAASEQSRLFAVYLDEYHVSASHAARVRDAVRGFLDSLGPNDLVTIMRPLDSLLSIRLTHDREALRRIVDSFEGRKGDYQPRTTFERNYMANDPERAEGQRTQATWSSLNALVVHLANLRSGRKTVLFVSEQADPVTRRRGLESLPTSSGVLRAANRSNTAIYVLDPRDGDDAAAEGAADLLRVVADDTDGRVIAGSDLEAGLRQMVADASGYYLLTYRSSQPADGRFHSVAVTVKRTGIRVRARKGYFSPTLEEIQRAVLIARASEPRPARPIEPARRISPLIRPWFGISRGIEGKTRVTFVWEPSGPVPGDRNVRTATRLALSVIGTNGASVFTGTILPASPGPAAADAPARAVFEVAPGRFRLQMSIEDAASQTIDTDVRDLIVRELRGKVALGTPEVLRARTARDLRAIDADPDAVPIASREFSRSEQLVIRVPAYADGERPVVSARLLNRAGHPMRTLQMAGTDLGENRREIALPLAMLAPGDYSVEITATTPSGAVREAVSIRVTN